jgi:hypothetical protein
MSYQPLKLQHTLEVSPVVDEQHTPSFHDHAEFHDFAFTANEPYAPAAFTTFDADAPQSIHESRTPKHKNTWSSSTNTTAVTSEEVSSLQSNDHKGKSEKRNSRVLSPHGTWTFEILALAVAIGAVAAIIGVVFRYNGRALPDWPHDITLNALIALLATFANATISVCLASGISQAKWIRFKQGAAPLSDVEIFDEASRGTWGSLKLLVTARGG